MLTSKILMKLLTVWKLMQQQLLQTMLVDISAVLTGEQMKIIYSDYMWVGRFDADNLRSASEVLGKYQMELLMFLLLLIFNPLEILSSFFSVVVLQPNKC